MRPLAIVFALLALTAPAAALPPAPETGPCSLAEAAPATLAVVDEGFEFLLDDGRRLALAGLDFPPAQRAAAARLLGDWLTGAPVFVDADAPDRWGRAPARIFAASEDEPGAPLVSVGAALLDAGLARFRPDPAASACAGAYLSAEAAARAARRGLWGGAEPPLVNLVGDPASMQRALKAIVAARGLTLVEGVISSIGEAHGAAYLNFGFRRGQDFAVVISKRDRAIFENSGMVLRALVGRRARVRGLIDTTSGPRMDLTSPAQLELVDDAPAR